MDVQPKNWAIAMMLLFQKCLFSTLLVFAKANTEGKTLVTGALFLAGGQAGGS